MESRGCLAHLVKIHQIINMAILLHPQFLNYWNSKNQILIQTPSATKQQRTARNDDPVAVFQLGNRAPCDSPLTTPKRIPTEKPFPVQPSQAQPGQAQPSPHLNTPVTVIVFEYGNECIPNEMEIGAAAER